VRERCLEFLWCPRCHRDLSLVDARVRVDDVESGRLCCTGCDASYPILGRVARFVPPENYARSFGLQWNVFRRTQLDSHSGLTISRDRFSRQTAWSPGELRGQTVLDVGCGAGRFAEVASSWAGHVVAVDYSSAVDACAENLRDRENVDVMQADLYALPFRLGRFDFVYSLGVLQHTPDVRRAFMSLPPQVASGGRIVVDVYARNWGRLAHPRTWLRPLTTHIASERLFGIVQTSVPPLLGLSRLVARIPLAGRWLRRLVPVANYENVHPLSPAQMLEWAILDTYDWFAPKYDSPQTAATLRAWMAEAGLEDIEVFVAHHLTGRGRKPAAVPAG
jgi:SAM-dependent methyltransferase